MSTSGDPVRKSKMFAKEQFRAHGANQVSKSEEKKFMRIGVYF